MAELGSALPSDARRAVLIRGAGGAAAAPVRDALLALDLNVTELSAAGEPSVMSVNALLDLMPDAPDVIIACGGGAVMDAGKAAAFLAAHGLRLGDDFGEIDADLLARPCPVPLIVSPTTAGTGAEVTSNAVLDVPSQRAKISLRGRGLFPAAAFVDPALMVSAPPHVTLNAGLDAVTQIIEAYTSSFATVFSDALSQPNVMSGLQALRAVATAQTPETMSAMAWTSLASGMALAHGGLGAAHGLASVVGGRYAAPHGALCGRFLVPVIRENLAHAEVGSEAHHRLDTVCEAIASVFVPLAGQDDVSGLEAWVEVQKLPRLEGFGIRATDIETLATQSMTASSSRKNAVALDKTAYESILHASL